VLTLILRTNSPKRDASAAAEGAHSPLEGSRRDQHGMLKEYFGYWNPICVDLRNTETASGQM
jgi:hypothetical protein